MKIPEGMKFQKGNKKWKSGNEIDSSILPSEVRKKMEAKSKEKKRFDESVKVDEKKVNQESKK